MIIDFIGVGAQKAGTSWIYACLFEHPEICAPMKELHFFSRERFSKGRTWYEQHFKRCKNGLKKGEFSTSYLYSKDTPKRIRDMYPDVKIIVILRNPVERAFSQYKNAIKAGEIKENVSFGQYIEREPSCLEQGYYSEQLERYRKHFRSEQILVLLYEDIKKDPKAFMSRIYRFLEVDETFVASFIHKKINVARVPKNVAIERIMHHMAEFLRKIGLDQAVHTVRKTGLSDAVRSLNSKERSDNLQLSENDCKKYVQHFKDDVKKLSTLLGSDISKIWNIN